jgi:hypothetical protein
VPLSQARDASRHEAEAEAEAEVIEEIDQAESTGPERSLAEMSLASQDVAPEDDVSEFFVSSESSSDGDDDEPPVPAEAARNAPDDPDPYVFVYTSSTPKTPDVPVNIDQPNEVQVEATPNPFLEYSLPDPTIISPRAYRAARRSSGASATPASKSPRRRSKSSGGGVSQELEEVRRELAAEAAQTPRPAPTVLADTPGATAPETPRPGQNVFVATPADEPPATPQATPSRAKLSPRKSALKSRPSIGDLHEAPTSPTLRRKRKSVVFGEPEYKTIANRDDPAFKAEQAAMRVSAKRRRVSPRLSTERAAREERDKAASPTRIPHIAPVTAPAMMVPSTPVVEPSLVLQVPPPSVSACPRRKLQS